MTTYKESGVDLVLGNNISEILYNACKESWVSRKGMIGEIIEMSKKFSGRRGIDISGLPRGTRLGANSDGIGSKIELAERTRDHTTMAQNLIAMIADDAAIQGAEPIFATNVFDFRKGNSSNFIEIVRQIATGMRNACVASKIPMLNGETAQLEDRVDGYGEFNYNWSGTVVWIAKNNRLIYGQHIKPGDSVVAVYEPGFRSNGFGLVRRIMKKMKGEEWHNEKFGDSNETYGQKIIAPSIIYTPFIVDMTGGYDGKRKVGIAGMAHITGGGIPEKLGRLLSVSGFGARLDNLFSPSDIMVNVIGLGHVEEQEAYRTLNMGNGLLVVTTNPGDVCSIAKKYGLHARKAGTIIPDPAIYIEGTNSYVLDKILKYDVNS